MALEGSKACLLQHQQLMMRNTQSAVLFNLTSSPQPSPAPLSNALPTTLVSLLSDPTLLLRSLNAAELSMVFLPIACYWAYSTFLCALSVLRFTSVELHRIPTAQAMRPKNRVAVPKVLATVAVQHVVQAVVALLLAVATRPADADAFEMEHWAIVVVKLFVASLMMDTWQYWMHRWMHVNRFLYRNFHSVHHQLTVPYAFGALYNHPLEGFIMDTLGGGIPSLVLDMHPWTSCLFFCIATLKTVDDHCGYAWSWSPFKMLGLANGADYHDIHHWGKGIKYNFSQPFYTFWDVWMGTEYYSAMEKKEREKATKEDPAESPTSNFESDKGSIRKGASFIRSRYTPKSA
ncbi:hypothetical protein HDU67_002266 [Dinochytrium kinnereticum]|nr:hypothetical protein HDU67_002266 [Dinochytrium kinnereticum]